MCAYFYIYFRFRLLCYGFALFLKHSLVKKLHVQVVTNTVDISVLLRTEQVPRSSDFKVAQCHLEARTELGELFNGGKSFRRFLADRLTRAVSHICVSLTRRASDAPSYLVKLRKSESVCIFYNQGICRRKVNSGLNNGRANENVNLRVDKRTPYILYFVTLHLTVSNRNTSLWELRGNPVSDKAYRADLVVKVEHLTSP